MTSKIFIDTGAFFAKYYFDDAHHSRARKIWKKISQHQTKCITTNLVVNETITLISYRCGHMAAAKVAREIYGSQAIEIVFPSEELSIVAIEWLEKFEDQEFSMTDVCSFAVMTELKLKKAFAFDKDFTVAGFEVL